MDVTRITPTDKVLFSVCSETNKKRSSGYLGGQNPSPRLPLPQVIVQMSLCLPSHGTVTTPAPSLSAQLCCATQGGHCVLFIFAECHFCEQAQCLLPKNHSEVNTRISTDCSVQLLLIFAPTRFCYTFNK